MEIKQLTTFVRVAELGSFSRAALAMQAAQPLLSRHVRQLEVELGHSLLHRNGRGVSLTPAGQVLLGHARGLLHQAALAREELGALRGARAGRVAVGLPPSLAKLITVPLARAFVGVLPGARLTLTEGFSVALLDGLHTGRVDVALMYHPPTEPELERTVVHDEPLVVIAPARWPPGAQRRPHPSSSKLTLGQLAKWPLIVPSRPNAFRLLLDNEMARLGQSARIVMEVDGLNAILDLVAQGLGCAVLPRYTLRTQPDAAQRYSVWALRGARLHSQLTLVRSARRASTPTQEATLALLKDVIVQALA